MRQATKVLRGGGILLALSAISLNAIELRDACTMDSGNCNIKNHYTKITNTGFFTLGTHNNPSIIVDGTSTIDNFINYGQIETYISLSGTINHLTNYGTMEGISVPYNNHQNHIVTIENYGTINSMGNGKKYHFNKVTLRLQAYAMRISVDSAKFNAFDGNLEDNSHLVLDSVNSVSFADKNSKIILDFGSGFEFGKGYSLSKLVVDIDGNNKLNVGFDRLTTRTSLYKLTQRGDNFIASIDAPNSEIGILYKANIRTMNNFYTISNSMIYPRKVYHSQNLRSSSLRASEYERGNPLIKKSLDSALDSTNHLKSYESFAYRNESINRRIQRQNKRNYSRTKRNNNSVILSESEESQKSNNRDSSPKAQNDNGRKSQNQMQNPNYSQTPHDYYFILTPFINHNHFFESGNYNLRGFDYGFLTAFSTRVAESNSLGAHFIFSYGSLGDSKDKDLSIKSLNLNVGINYKLDLIYDMYLKARGDFYYFSNALDSLTIKNIKPNNLGFGASLIFGKDFDFGKGGVLGIEVGIDYKALKTNAVSLNSQSYKQSLLNLIYADLGVSYNKYFGGFGLNLGTGFKANLAQKLAESILILNTQNLRFTIDNDKYLGYANAGISYLLQTKNFDMEFSLAYYGNYGDRVISNGGGVEFRVEF